MQLRQAEALAVFDHHQAGVGHIDADFDNGGGDQQLQFPGLEALHHRLFLCRLHPPVQQADAQAGQGQLQSLERRLRRLRFHQFAVFDQRANPVHLPAFAAGGADAIDHFAAALAAHHHGRYRRAARRHFVDHRHVEIGVGRHRQGARDRRRGHHQLVRHQLAIAALVAQGQALVHAEAVLLVDDGQGQILAGHAFLHQGMRADHHARRAGGDVGQHGGARLAGHLARQPHHAHAERLQPGAEIRQMLLRQQFGRRHQGDLSARFDVAQGRQGRDHRLAAADIALHQAQHGLRLLQIRRQFLQHPLLRRRERVGKPPAQRLAQFSRAANRRGAVRAQGDALAAQAEVMRQQFFQRQTLQCRMQAGAEERDIGVWRRPMREQQGFAQGRQFQVIAQRGRQQLQFFRRRQALERFADDLRQRLRADAFDRRIDGIEAIAQAAVFLFGKEAIARMHHLQPVRPGPRLAITAHAPSGQELRRLAAAEMEEAQRQRRPGIVVDGHPQQGPITESAFDRLHPAFDLRGLPRTQFADRRQARAVFVTQGQMQPKILQARQSARRELFRQRRANAGQDGDRRLARRRERGRFAGGVFSHSAERENRVHFHLRAARQGGHLDGGTRRIRRREILGHHRVDGGEIAEIDQIDADAHHIVERTAGGAADRLQVVEHAPRLRGDVAFDQLAAGGIERNLPGQINAAAAAHGLRIRADGGRRLVGGDGLARHGRFS